MSSTRRRAAAWLTALAFLAPLPALSADFTREQVAEQLAALPAGGRINLAGRSLNGLDLSRLDFTGGDLHGADLSGANLTGADLHQADFVGANLAGANLTGAIATGTNFEAAEIKNAIGLDSVKGLDRTGAR